MLILTRDRPRQGVLEAGRDAEGPVAARGLVSGYSKTFASLF